MRSLVAAGRCQLRRVSYAVEELLPNNLAVIITKHQLLDTVTKCRCGNGWVDFLQKSLKGLS